MKMIINLERIIFDIYMWTMIFLRSLAPFLILGLILLFVKVQNK